MHQPVALPEIKLTRTNQQVARCHCEHFSCEKAKVLELGHMKHQNISFDKTHISFHVCCACTMGSATCPKHATIMQMAMPVKNWHTRTHVCHYLKCCLDTVCGVNLEYGTDWSVNPKIKLRANKLTRPDVKQSNSEQESWKHLAMAHPTKHNSLIFVWFCTQSDSMLPN